MTTNHTPLPTPESKDYLGLQLREMPYFRGLLRAVEAQFYQDIDLPTPTLDLGCGDGHFAQLTFNRPLEVGTDPWWGPLTEAKKRDSYHSVLQSDGAEQRAGRLELPVRPVVSTEWTLYP